MKKVIERIRTAAALAVLLTLCAASSARADVTPAAVWESDFGVQKTRGAYTLTLPNDSWVDSDGNLNIASGDTSAKISFTGGGSTISVLMEYENAVASSATAGMIPIIVNPNNTGNQFGVKVYESGSLGLSGSYQTGTVYPTSGTRVMTTMPSSGVLLFSMPNGSACSVYSATTREGLTATDAGSSINGLLFSNSTLTQIGLGGPVAKLNYISNFTGLKIKKVAIFKSAISASDAAAYVFPSESSDYSATVTAANTAWVDISWDNSATWDDTADNTSKSVYLKFADGASVVRDGGLAAGSVYLHGEGSLNFTASSGTEATVSSAIGGDGAVVAQSGTIKFTGANSFSGGLTIKSGAIATTTSTSGFGAKDYTVTVENGGAADIAKTGASTYKFVIEGTGVNNSGALYSTEAIGGGAKQAQSIALTGDATITVGANWGIINDGFAAANLSLNSYTLTKNGSGRFWLCNTTISGTGTIKVETGFLDTISSTYTSTGSSSKIKICSGATMFIGGDTALDGLDYTFGNLSIGNLEIDAGGNVSVASGRTLTVTSSLVSNGTITDNGTITCSGTISGADQSITIGSGATFTWRDSAWTSGDYFTGTGTLNLNGNQEHAFANSSFEGIVKATHNGTFVFNNYPAFTSRPELVCDCSADNKAFALGASYAGKSLTVRNLNGGISYFTPQYGDGAAIRVIDTLQTRNTTFSGKFISDTPDSAKKRMMGLTIRGSEATGLHSLELTKASTTFGKLTVASFSKLIFSSSGSWANGTVTVADGGYLEVNHSGTVASMLDLQSGGTITIKTVTTTTTTGEGDEAVEETTTSVVPIAAGTVTFPDSGKAFIDISLIPDLETDESVTLIRATTIADIANIRPVGKPYALKVEGNELKVVNDGGLVWDSTSGWNGKDVTKYGEATITSPGTVALGGTSLSFDTLKLAGSGTVSFSRTGDETIAANNIVIDSGVTLDASAALDLTGATISGDGTLNIPAGTTYSMDDVNCSAKITCAGTLETSGATTLSSTATTISGTIDVLSDTTTLATAKCGITGTVTIEPDAWLSSPTWDALDYNGTTTLNVYGTINLQDVWSFASGNTLNFYNGCTITDAGNSHVASYDLVGGPIYVKPGKDGATGTVDLSAVSRLRANTVVNVAEGMTFTVSGQLKSSGEGTGFGFTKQGSGIFNLTPSSMAAFNGTTRVSEGQMIMTSLPAGNTVIAEGATFTLKNAAYTEDRFSGEGTLELLNDSTTAKEHTATSTFSGKLKVTRNGTGHHVIGANSANTTLGNILITGTPSLEVGGSSPYLCLNRQVAGNWLAVKNLTASSSDLTVDAVYGGANDNTYVVKTIKTLQTKDTTFAGKFNGASKTGRRVDLYVYGENETVHSLELTGDNTTAYGTLTAENYGKVKFSGSGNWAEGNVVVGANGWLESSNAGAVTALTLSDGANIAFPTDSSRLTGITSLTFTSGKTYISFADGAPDSGTLIDWSSVGSAPDGDFELVGDVAETHVLTKSATGLTIAKGVASVTTTSGVMHYSSVAEARLQAMNAGENLLYFTIVTGGDVSIAYFEGMKIKNAGGANITITGVSSEYTMNSSTEDGVTTYTRSNAPTAYVWTDAYSDFNMETDVSTPNHNWTVPENWNVVGGTAAGRYPDAGDTVTFNDGATVTLNATASVAGGEVNGAVSISGSGVSLNVFGNITGSGTLTLSDVCLASAGAGITVAPAVNFTNDSELAGGNALTLNGDVAISDTFKVWNSNHAINGNVTINSGVTFKYGALLLINGAATVKGAFTRDAGSTSCIKFCGAVTIENGNVSIDGWQSGNLDDAATVVLAGSGASLTDTRGTPITANKVSTTVVKSYVKNSGNTYSVDAYNVVTVAASNATVQRTDELSASIKDGDEITFTVASAEGYVVTGVTATPEGDSPETLTADNNGVYSYVVNGNVTIAVSVTAVAEPSFDVYYADYSKAQTVTLEVSDYVEDSQYTYTLQVGDGTAVTGEYDSTAQTVTFRNVEGFTPGAAVNYTITVSGAAAGTKSGTVTAAAPAVPGWVNETKTTIGTASATGTWSPDAPTFGDAGSAALSGETTFTANSQASGKVTLTTVVNFGNEAAPTLEISADAKAAIKVENNSFKIWTKTTVAGEKGASADWLTVSGATPNLEADSTVVFTFDTDAKTFTVSVGGNALYYGASDANTSFAFASDGVAISSVAYKGAGSFTSLTGEYTTTDIAQTVDGKGVVVANSFISGNAALREMTIEEAAAALAPGAPVTDANKNGLNYFKCYALGLDPTKADDKPIVDVTTDAEGKFVFTVKHPVYNAQGEIIGYEEINAADNVSTTVTLKYGTDASSITTVEKGAASGISPADMFEHAGAGNVLYYKAEVSISAK